MDEAEALEEIRAHIERSNKRGAFSSRIPEEFIACLNTGGLLRLKKEITGWAKRRGHVAFVEQGEPVNDLRIIWRKRQAGRRR